MYSCSRAVVYYTQYAAAFFVLYCYCEPAAY